jgi:hypothetical protein
MKQVSSIALLAFIMATVFSSCEKTIDVNTPPYVRKITVNNNTESGQPLYVMVGTSAAIKDQKFQPDLTIRNADVKLYVDGIFTETIPFDTYAGYQSATIAQPGKKYTVKVTAPSYDPAEGEVIVPSVVPITGITYTPFARKNEEGEMQDAVTITFTDPTSEGDFYIISINEPKDSFSYSGDFCVNSNDASVETNASEVTDVNTCLENNFIFVRDVLFNGRQKEIRFYANSHNLQPRYNGFDTTYATITLHHVTEAAFRFSKSARIASDVNGNPFAEPVNVYSNITGGLGIFSVLSLYVAEIK